MTSPALVDAAVPDRAEGVVLVLHGGAARADRPGVSPTQLSVLRMRPVATAVARAGEGRLAVLRVLNSRRGWDERATPVDDVHWALGQVRDRFGGLPVGLVGHSLGGRAALLAGATPAVRSVVALNPWLVESDDADLTGTPTLVVHGDQDRVASLARAEVVAARLARRTDLQLVVVPGAGHAMLRHGARFERLASDFVVSTLLSPT